jgi:hypothetical protein
MESSGARTEAKRYRWFHSPLSPGKLGFITLSVIAVLFLVGGGTTYASQQSLPDDKLYPVKIASENIQLYLASDGESKADIQINLVQRRINEIVATSSSGTAGENAYERVPMQIDAAVSQIAALPAGKRETKMRQLEKLTVNQQEYIGNLCEVANETVVAALSKTIDSLYNGEIITRMAAANDEFLSASPSSREELLSSSFIKIEGTVVSASPGSLNVSGLVINNLSINHPIPPPGTGVKFELISNGGKNYIGRIESTTAAGQNLIVAGKLAITKNGNEGFIGSIPVYNLPISSTPLPTRFIEVEGTVNDGKLVTREIKASEHFETSKSKKSAEPVSSKYKSEEDAANHKPEPQRNDKNNEKSGNTEKGESSRDDNMKSAKEEGKEKGK